MNLEEAIKTAIEFETRVHDLYAKAAEKATEAASKRMLEVLAKEEGGHLAYLESRLDEWQKTGSIVDEELGTAIPSKEAIEEGLEKLKARMEPKKSGRDVAPDIALLQKAIKVEAETGAFYERMVGELSGEGKRLFARFLEIEQGHQAIVQAEMDSVSGLGFWFDTTEFNLENG